jgi:hypothetical protein
VASEDFQAPRVFFDLNERLDPGTVEPDLETTRAREQTDGTHGVKQPEASRTSRVWSP